MRLGLGDEMPTDPRWTQALTGLPVLAFVRRNEAGVAAEVTGVDGDHVWLVVDGETEPRRVFWTNVRPLAPYLPTEEHPS